MGNVGNAAGLAAPPYVAASLQPTAALDNKEQCKRLAHAIRTAVRTSQFAESMLTGDMAVLMDLAASRARTNRCFATYILNFVKLAVVNGDNATMHKAIACVRADAYASTFISLVDVMFGLIAVSDFAGLRGLVMYLRDRESSLPPNVQPVDLCALLLWAKAMPGEDAAALASAVAETLVLHPEYCSNEQYSTAFITAANQGYADVATMIDKLEDAEVVQLKDKEKALKGICRHGLTALVRAAGTARSDLTSDLAANALSEALHNGHYDTAQELVIDLHSLRTYHMFFFAEEFATKLARALFGEGPGADNPSFMTDPTMVRWLLEVPLVRAVPRTVLWRAWKARTTSPQAAEVGTEIETSGVLDVAFFTALHKVKHAERLTSADAEALTAATRVDPNPERDYVGHGVQPKYWNQKQLLRAIMLRAALIPGDETGLTLRVQLRAQELFWEGLQPLLTHQTLFDYVAVFRGIAQQQPHKLTMPMIEHVWSMLQEVNTRSEDKMKASFAVLNIVLLRPPAAAHTVLGGNEGQLRFVSYWWRRFAAQNPTETVPHVWDALWYQLLLEWERAPANAETWDSVLAGFQAAYRVDAHQFAELAAGPIPYPTNVNPLYVAIAYGRPDDAKLQHLVSYLVLKCDSNPTAVVRVLNTVAAPHFTGISASGLCGCGRLADVHLTVFQCVLSKLRELPDATQHLPKGASSTSALLQMCLMEAARTPHSDNAANKASWLLATFKGDIAIEKEGFRAALQLLADRIELTAAVVQHALAQPLPPVKITERDLVQWIYKTNELQNQHSQQGLVAALLENTLPAVAEAATAGFDAMLQTDPELLRSLVANQNAVGVLVYSLNKPYLQGIASIVLTGWAEATGFAPIPKPRTEADRKARRRARAQAREAEAAVVQQRVDAAHRQAAVDAARRRRQHVRTLGNTPPEAGVADVTEQELRAVLRHDAAAASRVIADVLNSREHTYELNWRHPSVTDQAPVDVVDWTTWTKQGYNDHLGAYRQALADYNTAKVDFTDKVKEFVTEYPPPPDQAAEYADELEALQTARARLRAAMLAFYRYQEIYLERSEQALKTRRDTLLTQKQQHIQRVLGTGPLPERWLLTSPNPADPGSVLHDWENAGAAGAGDGTGTGLSAPAATAAERALQAALADLGNPEGYDDPDLYDVLAESRGAPRARLG